MGFVIVLDVLFRDIPIDFIPFENHKPPVFIDNGLAWIPWIIIGKRFILDIINPFRASLKKLGSISAQATVTKTDKTAKRINGFMAITPTSVTEDFPGE
jgi:hypothetical protein